MSNLIGKTFEDEIKREEEASVLVTSIETKPSEEITYLSAMDLLRDLETLDGIELALLSTESAEVISHYATMLNGYETSEEFTAESAIAGKEGLLNKIKDIRNKISASNDEVKNVFGKLFDNILVGEKKLLKLKEELESGRLVMREKFGPLSNKRAEDLLTNKCALLRGLGMDPNNVNSIIKLLTLPGTLATEMLEENFNLLNAMQDSIAKDPVTFKKALEEGKLKKATKSIAFIKSLKGVELKDLDIIAGFPVKVFAETFNIIILHNEKGEIKVESDVVRFKDMSFVPQKNIADMVKIVDVAIKEFNTVKQSSAKLKALAENSTRFKDLVLNTGPNVVSPLSSFNKMIRFKQNILRATVNVRYDFSAIDSFTRAYVKLMTTKA